MNFILSDGSCRDNLLPFTFSRPVADIRIGILTIREKWNHYLNTETGTMTYDYLSQKYPISSSKKNIVINASVLPDKNLTNAILNLGFKEKLVKNKVVIASGFDGELLDKESLNENLKILNAVEYIEPISQVEHVWNIFQLNKNEIEKDFELLTSNRQSEPISDTNKVIGTGKVFLEENAKVECSIINCSGGSVYIGRNAEVMEGSMIRGSFALCSNAILKMGSKIYGATTIGPHCKVGGEVNNSVIFGYSNKAHDGFLGNSVIGEWCNLGADTNNSNLKNNYSNIKIWSFAENDFIDTGLQFCGLFMGDHSKAAINTMFNTGTVVGFCSNIFSDSFPPKSIPSFSWGGSQGFETFDLNKAKEMATLVMSRRNVPFNQIEESIFNYLFKNL